MQKNAIFSKTKQFRAMVSIDDRKSASCDICLSAPYINSLTYLHGLFKEPITGPLKSKTAEIRHLENRHDVIFSAEGSPIWIKFRRLLMVLNDMSTAVIWSKLKPEV